MNTRFYKFIIALALTFFACAASAQFQLPALQQQADSVKQQPVTFRPSPDVYVKNLGIMCRQEQKIEKYFRVPIRVRMGTLEHCNYLEGKRY